MGEIEHIVIKVRTETRGIRDIETMPHRFVEIQDR